MPRVWESCREEHTGQAGFTSFSLLMSDLEIDQELSNLGGREGGRQHTKLPAEYALLNWVQYYHTSNPSFLPSCGSVGGALLGELPSCGSCRPQAASLKEAQGTWKAPVDLR